MVEDMTEALDTINLEVGEDLLLGEGEDPQIETEIVIEIENTKCGMRSKPLDQGQGLGPTKIIRSGRKIPGKSTKLNIPQDTVETIETIETKINQ